VHAAHVAIHGVGASYIALMVFAWACTQCTGAVVINVAAMCMAVVPIFESFYQRGGGSGRGLVACVAATVATAVATTAAVVAAATAVVATTTVPLATAAAKIAAAAAVVSAVVSAATMLLAVAPPAVWAAWVLLLVLDGRRRLAGSNCLTQHLNLSLHSRDVGGGGS
jgi:hypothetical protein